MARPRSRFRRAAGAGAPIGEVWGARCEGSRCEPEAKHMKADLRPTLSRAEAVTVYDGFALKGHIGGKDASSGYGGPAIAALLSMAAFADAKVNHPCALVLK